MADNSKDFLYTFYFHKIKAMREYGDSRRKRSIDYTNYDTVCPDKCLNLVNVTDIQERFFSCHSPLANIAVCKPEDFKLGENTSLERVIECEVHALKNLNLTNADGRKLNPVEKTARKFELDISLGEITDVEHFVRGISDGFQGTFVDVLVELEDSEMSNLSETNEHLKETVGNSDYGFSGSDPSSDADDTIVGQQNAQTNEPNENITFSSTTPSTTSSHASTSLTSSQTTIAVTTKKLFCISETGMGQCKNGGTCIEKEDSFKCNCKPNFSGEICDIKLPCLWVDCSDHGECTNEDPYVDVNSFDCECNSPWVGRWCNRTFRGVIQ